MLKTMFCMRQFIPTALLVILLAGCAKEPQTLEELIRAGEKAFIDQDYAKAREYLTKAVVQKPSDRHLLYILGISYQRDFLYDSAFHYLKRVDLLFPDDREVNLELYKIAQAIQEWKSAIKAIQVLIKTGDPIEQYYSELADLNLNVKNYSVAYYFYRILLEAEPDNRNNYLAVANLAAQLDSLDISLAVVDSAIERFADSDEFVVNKGLYLAAMKRYEESEAVLRSLLAKDSGSAAVRLNLANALASQDDRAKKREALQLYLQLRPTADDIFRLDSAVDALREELNIED